MFTQSPEIINDATIGQVVVQPTATPTSTSGPSQTSTPTSSPSLTVTPSPTPIYTFPTVPPFRRYRQNALTIYGYGPINAEISLRGFGVSEKVTSDPTGLFKFTNIYSFTSRYPELCIQGVDAENRVTQPSCIPGLPSDGLIPLEVGPVLLSPTISVSENKIKAGETAILTGKTTPNTLVNIFIYKNESNSKLSFVNEAYAYGLPAVDIKSDENGNYGITLPTSDDADYNIFASTKFNENQSAKSNTLKFVVLSSIKSFFERLWNFLVTNKIVAFILLEATIIMILFVRALKSTTIRRRRHSEVDYLAFISKNTN